MEVRVTDKTNIEVIQPESQRIEVDVTKLMDEDYFNFDGNEDIELQRLVKKYDTSSGISKETQKEIDNYFYSISKQFRTCEFNKLSFPYLNNSISLDLEVMTEKLQGREEKEYFLCKLLNNYGEFKTTLSQFYKTVITDNEFGMMKSVHDPSLMKASIRKSKNFTRLIDELSKWYVSTEFIFFNLKLLDIFYGVKIPFEDKNLSLEQNYGFSMKSFAKKSLLKLSTYVVSKLSGSLGGGIDYYKLSILLLSGFTCGFTTSALFKVDIGLMAFAGSMAFNYLIGALQHKLEKYTDLVEVDTIVDIVKKLNKKVKKIRNKLYFLLKIHLTDSKGTKYDIPLQINEIYLSMQKYMKDINYDEEKETVIFKEVINFEERSVEDSVLHGDWSVIELVRENKKDK